MQTSTLGLRDRKRIETRRRIAEAALTLALEHGKDGATIESISSLADVSPRTFFNYFESKEAALIDAPAPDELRSIVDEVVADSEGWTLGETAVRMFVHRIARKLGPNDAHRRRVELYTREPSLYVASVQRMMSEHEVFAVGLLEVARRRCLDVGDPGWATAAISAAGGAIRYVLDQELAAGRSTVATSEEIFERAYAVISTTWERLR